MALVAESGLGKTRLVQEFYRWLATSEDGTSGYWPADLAAIDDNLQINPDPAHCDGTRPVPFLWWGLRLPDPGARNQAVAGQLASSLETLTPHLEPALRTERRRKAGWGMTMAAGNVAFDLASNLVPPLGLLKTLGQGALDLGQHARTLWRDRTLDTPDRLHGQQREDLADRIVSDFSLLCSRDHAETPAVPVVIVVDDGQFSEHDPSIVTCVEKLMTAAVAGRWRMLFVVTYWTAEWNRHFRPPGASQASTIAGVVHERYRDFDHQWQPMHLTAVADLSPIVSTTLPGLEPAQAAALVERAGGNPRYLDEILRYCERNERLFVGRSLQGPLTDKGLATVRERTVDLHDLVEERLRLLEPDVRRALLLASVQGQEFLAPLVSEVSAILRASAGEPELARAEDPHAFIHRQPGRLGAFAQRVFHEVAVGQVGNDFDEDDVQEALRDVLRRRLDAFEQLLAEDDAARVRTCLLASQLLTDTDDEEDPRRESLALVHLAHHYQARHDHQLASQFGARLAERLLALPPGSTPGYPYHVAAESLLDGGRLEDADRLVAIGLDAQRTLVAHAADPGPEQVLALLLRTASRCARARGRSTDAEHALREALDIHARAAQLDDAPGIQRDLFVSWMDVGQLAQDRGDLDSADDAYRQAYAIALALDEISPSPRSGEDLVGAWVARGDVATARGDLDRARALYGDGLARLVADEAATSGDPVVEGRRAGVLERIARTALARGEIDAAQRAIDEAVPLRQGLVARLGTPYAHVALANALRQLGDVHWDRQDLAAAWQAFAAGITAIESAGEVEPTPWFLRIRSLALDRVGRMALALDDLDTAEAVFERRLELDRVLAESVQTPTAWREVLTSEFWLADIAEQRGHTDVAVERFRLALGLAQDLLAHQETPAAHDDVRRIVARLERLG